MYAIRRFTLSQITSSRTMCSPMSNAATLRNTGFTAVVISRPIARGRKCNGRGREHDVQLFDCATLFVKNLSWMRAKEGKKALQHPVPSENHPNCSNRGKPG